MPSIEGAIIIALNEQTNEKITSKKKKKHLEKVNKKLLLINALESGFSFEIQ